MCDTTSTFKDKFGYEYYRKCEYKDYCEATYREGLRGNDFVTKKFCKKHFNALEKNCKRVELRTGYKHELTYKVL